MNTPVIVGAGSCIIEAIIAALATIPGLTDKAELHLSQVTWEARKAVAPEILRRAAVLIEEASPWQGLGTLIPEERAHLADSCVTVTVPTLHFNTLWPLMTEDPRNIPEFGMPYGRLPFAAGDRLGLRLFQTLPDLDARRRAYNATDLRSVVRLERSHELEARNCFAREQGCDVRVAAYVMSHFRDKRLYYTHNHPTGELMYFVMCQLFAVPALRDLIKLPYDQLVVLARHWADTSNVFCGEEAPIHPAVAEHFKLKWWHPDLLYQWRGEGYTFDTWIDFYLSYDPHRKSEATQIAVPRILPRGRYLETQRQQSDVVVEDILAPSARIQRENPFITTSIDPALSPFGYMLTDAATQSYTTPDVFVARLTDAAVLGEDGMVLQDGHILADTFRNLTHGLGAPVIAAMETDRVTLRDDVSLTTRRLTGPYFCGFAGGWFDDAHWLVGTLPRLVTFVQLRERVAGLRIVLPHLPPTGLRAEMVALLGITRDEIVEIGRTEQLNCDVLYVTTHFDLWQMAPYCRIAAERLASLVPAEAGDHRTPERLHIVSDLAQDRITADPAALAMLAKRGFVTVNISMLPLRERIALVRAARYIVAQSGPGLAHILFAADGCCVLELFDPSQVQPMYWSIASVSGLQYGYLVGEPKRDGGRGFDVPIAQLSAAVGMMFGHSHADASA